MDSASSSTQIFLFHESINATRAEILSTEELGIITKDNLRGIIVVKKGYAKKIILPDIFSSLVIRKLSKNTLFWVSGVHIREVRFEMSFLRE